MSLLSLVATSILEIIHIVTHTWRRQVGMSLLSLVVTNEPTGVVRVMRALRVLRIFGRLPSLRKVSRARSTSSTRDTTLCAQVGRATTVKSGSLARETARARVVGKRSALCPRPFSCPLNAPLHLRPFRARSAALDTSVSRRSSRPWPWPSCLCSTRCDIIL